MAQLPCIHCGKMVEAKWGSNTVFYRPNGKTYAACTGGCDGEGAMDSPYEAALIAKLTDEQRSRSEVPEKDIL